MSDQYRLVFSSDPLENKKCPRCKEIAIECKCHHINDVAVDLTKLKLKIKNATIKGKTITIIEPFPPNTVFIKNLTSHMKKKFSCGGTFEIKQHGTIELQGDQKTKVIQFLKALGVTNL